MKWTLGILTLFFAAVDSAPGSRQGLATSASTNMSREGNSEPVTIETTTPNLFGDAVSTTPPNTESIELQHLNDDARFYPDYGDKKHLDGSHFTEAPSTRKKRQSIDYSDLNEEMYLDSSYSRKRRDSDQDPSRIDLDIPDDADSLSSDYSDVPTARSPVSDPDSVSTQITYVIISEDGSSGDEVIENVMEELKTDRGDYTPEAIKLAIPSSEQGTTNSDSSASTDSYVERNRVLRAIANTIRTKRSQKDRSRSSSVDTEPSSSSDIRPLTRKRRQIPYYRLPDFLNYRVGRSISESDTDDTEPDDAHGLNMEDLSMDSTDLKLTGMVTPLPEYAYEFSELTRPSSTYVDGRLQSYYVSERHKTKRSLPSEDSTEKNELDPTTEHGLEVVTAIYPLGIDATKNNLSLPEGNFLGPRIYAKGDLLQEEQPAVTGIAAPMEKVESVPVLNGAETETVYSAPVDNVNLPLIIPVIGPTSHPGEEPRIELSIPSGYVPYIIQLTPTKNETRDTHETSQESQHSNLDAEAASETATSSSNPNVPTELSFVPTIIITPSTPTSGFEVSTQTEAPAGSEGMPSNSKDAESTQVSGSSSTQATTVSLNLPLNLPEKETKAASKQKRAGWKDISVAPVGEVKQPNQKTAKWEFVSNEPTSGIHISQSTSSWRSVPVGEEELPQHQTSKWERLSNASEGEVEVTLEEHTAKWESASTVPTVEDVPRKQTAKWKPASSAPTEVEHPKQRTASWESVPVGEEDLPRQHTARWEPISNAPAGETETSTRDTHDRYMSAKSLVNVPGDIAQSASNDLVGTPPPQTSGSTPKLSFSQTNVDSALSEQAPPTRSGKLRTGKRNQVVPILEKNSVMSPNGSFSYSFKSGNGIQVEESGYLKKEPVQQGSPDSGNAQTVQGSYSYPAPDGRIIKVRYVADENGFRPEVEGLPKS